MAKFHINAKGVPSSCKAIKGNCPFGDEGSHFESKQIAQEFIDGMNEEEHGVLPGLSDKEKQEQSKERLTELFDDLVPGSGKAESVAGELVRATNKIGYRFFNDGDQVNSGYGNETCNGSLRYITNKLDELEGTEELSGEFNKLWNGDSMYDDQYEDQLKICMAKMADFIDTNPDLKTVDNKDDSTADFDEPGDYDYDEDEEDEWMSELDNEEDDWMSELDDDVDPYGNSYDDDDY